MPLNCWWPFHPGSRSGLFPGAIPSPAWRLGILVAAVLVVVMGLTRLHRGLILWAGVIFFSFALIFVVWLQNPWVIHHLGIFASGTLLLLTLLSLLSGSPFTLSYAREHTPRELWDSPAFIRANFIVTGAWGSVFLANTLVNVVKLHDPQGNEWFYRGIEFGLFALGVIFSTLYSRYARGKRSQLPTAEPS
jgi:hypothetical protein